MCAPEEVRRLVLIGMAAGGGIVFMLGLCGAFIVAEFQAYAESRKGKK
jgi:hypothetical protein